MTRREVLAAGGFGTLGIGIGVLGAEIASTDFPEKAVDALYAEREKFLHALFFRDSDRAPFLRTIEGRVALGTGAAISGFPTKDHEYYDATTDGSPIVGNPLVLLERTLVVDNLVVVDVGESRDWALINGPEGAGYVQLAKLDSMLMNTFTFLEAGRETRVKSVREFAARQSEVLVSSYAAYKDDKGKLRFTAKGFAFRGDNDFNAARPDVVALGQAIKTSRYLPLSRTVTHGLS